MSDHWELYPCSLDGRMAFVTYDHGFSEEADSLSFANYAGFRAPLRTPTDDGLPHGAEFDTLGELETLLVDAFGDAAIQVGRVTVGGYRYFHFYTGHDKDTCRALMGKVSEASGYELGIAHEADPERSHYWQTLYPSADDWQVIQDIRVEQSLREGGDPLSEPREVKHWAYFPTAEARAAFIGKVADLVELVSVSDESTIDGERFLAVLRHVGRPDYRSMNPFSIGLRRAAEEAGGDYDGWETQVLAGKED